MLWEETHTVTQTRTQRQKQQGEIVNLLLFFQNKAVRLQISPGSWPYFLFLVPSPHTFLQRPCMAHLIFVQFHIRLPAFAYFFMSYLRYDILGILKWNRVCNSELKQTQ